MKNRFLVSIARVWILASLVTVCMLAMPTPALYGQTRIDAAAYKEYLKSRKGMTSDGLMTEFPAGDFLGRVSRNPAMAQYLDSITLKYKLTDYERSLLSKNGFVVTERLSFRNFHDAFYDGFIKDLPVYISADAVLHAYHRTYSKILKTIEEASLKAFLDRALISAVSHLRSLPPSHSPNDMQARKDVDIFLTTALLLSAVDTLSVTPQLRDSPHRSIIDSLLKLIDAQQPASLDVYTSVPRNFDYSQMKPRGHYAGNPVLEAYFKSLMWLGRTEIYITAPQGVQPPVPPHDVQRQCMMAVLLAQILDASGANTQLERIETVLSGLIGEQDNLSTSALSKIVSDMDLSVESLTDTVLLKRFQKAAIDAGAGQQILSQILISGGGKDQQIEPAGSFILMGQRFLLDSYILSNVVFNRTEEKRMMPSPLDAMFVLGNDATAQLLKNEVDRFKYAANLAALRFLTNSLEPSYWETSVYTTWLGAIRGLNPPLDRSGLPQFMQTAAWWQKSINAQLGSWAELRHDNLLYGKQSYTGGLGCFYPKGFVEPVPSTYLFIGKGARHLTSILEKLKVSVPVTGVRAISDMIVTLNAISSVTDVLQSVSVKELNGEYLSVEEIKFIDDWLVTDHGIRDCVPHLTGHYHSMFYDLTTQVGMQGEDFIIADVHTQPTDESGNPVGRVLHVGTGYTNMAIVLAEDPTDKCLTAYIGPVGSYYEHITERFNRLTDADWSTDTKNNQGTKTPFVRPTWTNLYMANQYGEMPGTEMPSLNIAVTSVNNEIESATNKNILIAPNPAQGYLTITLTLPTPLREPVRIKVVDNVGNTVANIPTVAREANTHLIRWDGLGDNGIPIPSGSYLVVAYTGDATIVSKVVITR